MELLQNHLLINALIAWVAAQIIKAVIYLVVNRTFDIHWETAACRADILRQ